MTTIDYIILALIGLSMLLSFFRGFVRELLAVVNWLLAISATIYFSPLVANNIFPFIQNEQLRVAVSAILVFCTVFLLGLWMVIVLSRAADSGELTFLNRVLGLVFGFVRGLLLVIVVLFAARLFYQAPPQWWQKSVLINWVANMDNVVTRSAQERLDALYHKTENVQQRLSERVAKQNN